MAQGYVALADLIAAAPVWESHDADEINRLLNHPAVISKVRVGKSAPMDVSGLLADPRNRFFCGAHGGVSLNWTGPGIYQCHAFCAPEGTGRAALSVAEFAQAAMFGSGSADLIWAQVHDENRPACLFLRWLGFREGESVTAPFGADGATRSCRVFSMRIENWRERHSHLRLAA